MCVWGGGARVGRRGAGEGGKGGGECRGEGEGGGGSMGAEMGEGSFSCFCLPPSTLPCLLPQD